MRLKYVVVLAIFLMIAGIIRRWLFPNLPEWWKTASIVIFIVGTIIFVVYARRRGKTLDDRLRGRLDTNLYETQSHLSER